MLGHIKAIIDATNALGATVTCYCHDGLVTGLLLQAHNDDAARALAGRDLEVHSYEGKSWLEARLDIDGIIVDVMGPSSHAEAA